MLIKEVVERKLTKKEIKKRDKIADKDLPKAEFKNDMATIGKMFYMVQPLIWLKGVKNDNS